MVHGSVLSELGALQQRVVVCIAQPGDVAVLEPTVASRALPLDVARAGEQRGHVLLDAIVELCGSVLISEDDIVLEVDVVGIFAYLHVGLHVELVFGAACFLVLNKVVRVVELHGAERGARVVLAA